MRCPCDAGQISLGHEAFLLSSYVVAAAPLPHLLKPLILGLPCAIHQGVVGALALASNFPLLGNGWCSTANEAIVEQVSIES